MKKKVSQGKRAKVADMTHNDGIVGVIGSIPFASTTSKTPLKLESLELHGDWEILPAAEMRDGVPYLYRVIRKKLPKKFEKNLNGKKRRKSA